MADTKIKDLTQKTPAARTDELPINDVAGGNLDKYVTVADVLGQIALADIPLTSADIIVGNGSNVGAQVAMSNDATLSNTGAITLSATVRPVGKEDIWIPAAAMWANTTNPATGLTQTETSTNKLNYKSWSFGDNATSDKVEFTWTPPRQWDFSTVKATFHWLPLAGTGTVIWQLSGVAIGDNAAIDAAQGTLQAVTDTIQSTGNVHISGQTPAITIAGTPASTKLVQFRVTRDNSDTSTSAALLLGVTIEYSITQATAA